MKIKVNVIPEEGLTLSEKVNPADWMLQTPELKFIDAVELSASFRKDRDAVLVQVTAQGEQEMICDRCTAVCRVSYRESFDLGYSAKEIQALDISDDVRQEIILSYPVRFLCKENCLGLCTHCGKNLNEEPCSCASNISRGVFNAIT